MKKILTVLLILAFSLSLFGAVSALAKDEPEQANTIVHKFGGENGEWETDADNSTGVWSYYSCFGTIASKANLSLLESQTQYGNTEAYLQINKNGFIHPGASDPWSCLLVGYTVEKDGTLSGTLSATKDVAEGNGTLAMFVLNDDSGWISQVEVNTTETVTLTLSAMEVKAGDVIYLLVHHRNEIAGDGAYYCLDYTLVPTVEEESEPTEETITHKFGGENGEWETDADNSTGVWSYYSCFSTIDSKVNLTLNEEQTAYVNSEAYLQLNKSGFIHPGATSPWSCLLIGYTVETSGFLNGKMTANKAEEGGNGTIVMFVLNDDKGWISQVEVTTTETTVLQLENLKVKEGDTIYVLVHHNNNIEFDGTTYVIEYELQPKTFEEETPVADQKTVHKFGGEDGEWETDADNSTGVWSYYSCLGTIASKANLSLLEDQTAYVNSEAYLQLRKDGFIHPGATDPWSCLLVGYTVEKDGILSGTLVATKGEAGGNGTLAMFVLNDDDGWLCQVSVETVEPTTLELSKMEVKAGDTIYLLVHHNSDISYDGATYVLEYVLEDKPYEPVKPTEPTQPKLEGDLSSVNSIDQFRFVQGTKGLYYYYGKVSEGTSELNELTAAAITWDTAGLIPYLGIRMDGMMHPAIDENEAYMAVLGWKANGTKLVDLHLESIFDDLNNDGDGVTIIIYKNQEVLLSFSMSAKDNVANNYEPIIADVNRVEVEEGDMIYLAVAPNDTMYYDGIYNDFTISWVKEDEVESVDSSSESEEGSTAAPQGFSCGSSLGGEQAVLAIMLLAVAAIIGFKRKEN